MVGTVGREKRAILIFYLSSPPPRIPSYATGIDHMRQWEIIGTRVCALANGTISVEGSETLQYCSNEIRAVMLFATEWSTRDWLTVSLVVSFS